MGSFIKDNKIIFIYIVVLILLGIGFTYANLNEDIFKKFTGDVMRIDDRTFSWNNLDEFDVTLEPILDRDIFKKQDHVIQLSFLVGGSEDNTIDNIIYDISLKKLELDCSLLSPYVKWKLFKNGTEISNGSLDYHFDTIKDGRLVLTNIQQDLAKYSKDKSGYDLYSFYLWLSDSCQEEDIRKCQNKDDQSELMGKRLKGRIEVELYASKKEKLVRKAKSTIDTNSCLNKKGEVE